MIFLPVLDLTNSNKVLEVVNPLGINELISGLKMSLDVPKEFSFLFSNITKTTAPTVYSYKELNYTPKDF